MSDAFLANLPRFDGNETRLSSSQLRLLLGQVPAADAEVGQIRDASLASVSSHIAPDTAVDADVAPGRAPEFAEIEIMLSAMSDAIERIERESREHTVRVTQSISEKLFPELSRLFLADEIARHLPVMVPSSAPAVEIRAQPALLGKLRAAIADMPGLTDRCAVVAAFEDEDAQVRVSWETGGLTFDFDSLLKACLAQLGSPQTTIEEL